MNNDKPSKEALHKEFPECKKIIDEFRRVFGEVRVKYLEENGKSIGSDQDNSPRKRQ